MIVEHQGKRPRIGRDVYIAPNATVCGDVEIGDGTAILFGAVVTADGGTLRLGSNCVVMENAVMRATAHHPMTAGDNVLIGPQAYAVGCAIDDNVFLAAGTRVFNGARIGARTTVRINGIVHLRTTLPPDSTVPIGWVAVGDPPRILPPDTTRSGQCRRRSTSRAMCSASAARRRAAPSCPRPCRAMPARCAATPAM